MQRQGMEKDAPGLEKFGEGVGARLFRDFCTCITSTHGGKPCAEFSRCALEPGWHIKFKRSGKTLCTVYPRAGYFGVMVVVGPKQKQAVEMSLFRFSTAVQELYAKTRECNGQRWLLVDVKAKDRVYEDVLALVGLRCKHL